MRFVKMMLVLVFLLSVFPVKADNANCFEVSFPNPDYSKGTVDMVDWMLMDSGIRNQAHMEPGAIGNITFGNKIINTKFGLAKGDKWDVWTFDNDYTYFYLTGVPNTYSASLSESSNAYTLRYPLVGNPGTRLVNHCNQQVYIKDCVKGDVSSYANYITEVWGTFEYTFSGNIGHQNNVVSVKYYWNCWDTSQPNGNTNDPRMCTELEENWYVRPYGWVQWAHSSNPNRTGVFSSPPHTESFDSIEEGGPGFTVWCGFVEEQTSSSRPHRPVRTIPAIPIIIPTSLEGYATPAVWGANMSFTVTQNGINHYIMTDNAGHYRLDGLSVGPAMVSYIVLTLGGGSVNQPIMLHTGMNELNIKVW